MPKRYKVCGCFFDVACYCLHANADFVTFEKMCKENFDSSNLNDNGIFYILKAKLNVQSATDIACCRNFVEFQIDKFKVLADMFPLANIACNYAERCSYGDADFDYGVDQLNEYYNGDDDGYNSDGCEFNDADKVL